MMAKALNLKSANENTIYFFEFLINSIYNKY